MRREFFRRKIFDTAVCVILFLPCFQAISAQGPVTFRIEAEHFDDAGDYVAEYRAGASNDSVLRAVSTSRFSVAAYEFNGQRGIYSLRIRYLDEGDGAGTFRCRIDGQVLDSWIANLNARDGFLIREINGAFLSDGSDVKLESVREAGENGRIDYIEFTYDPVQNDPGTICEAETGSWQFGTIASSLVGHSGSGYVHFNRDVQAGITFNADLDTAMYYSLYFRYTLGNPLPVMTELVINDSPDVREIRFFPAVPDGVWQEQVITLPLDSGENRLELRAVTDSGLPTLDRLRIGRACVYDSLPEKARILYPPEHSIIDSGFEVRWLGSGNTLAYSLYLGEHLPLSANDCLGSTGENWYQVPLPPDGDYFLMLRSCNPADSTDTQVLRFTVRTAIHTYYLAPGGLDSNTGTRVSPFRTLDKALSLAFPGDTIFFLEGLYKPSGVQYINVSGTAAKRIHILAYPGHLVVIDCSGFPGRGMVINGSHIFIKGLIIQQADDHGIHMTGSYNRLELCTSRRNGDTGFNLTKGASYNQLVNCDAYLNYDPEENGEDADGFGAKFDLGPGNVFIGCRAWENSDDGYDFWQATETIMLDSCWAFANGINQWNVANFAGDGNGFKLGGNYYPGPHTLTRCVAFDNVNKGFDQNHNTGAHTLFNNTAFRNSNRNFSVGEAPVAGQHIFRNNLSYMGSNTIYQSSVQQTNSWNGFNPQAADFAGLDTAGVRGPRTSDGKLPGLAFLRLSPGSSLLDAGTATGLSYSGPAPDLGAFEGTFNPGTEIGFPGYGKDLKTLVVFPNPSHDYFNFIIPGNHSEDIQVKLFDCLGREVLSRTLAPSEKNARIPVYPLSPGLYYLRCEAMNTVYFSKIEVF